MSKIDKRATRIDTLVNPIAPGGMVSLSEGIQGLEADEKKPQMREVLHGVRDDIIKAVEKGVSYDRIAEFLAKNALPITGRQIRDYLKNPEGRKGTAG